MKRLLLLFTAVLLPLYASAQETTSDEFLRRYTNLVNRVGPSGIGVETLLEKWEAAYPDNLQMLLARFNFCFSKCQQTKVIQLDRDRYLGREPLIPMTDSTGVKKNFFEDTEYDDEMYGEALLAIDRAISLNPERLDVVFLKINGMIAYEKESPDMALQELKRLVTKHFTQHPAWQYEGVEKVDDDTFKAFMQDYCFTFFRLGSPSAAEAFRSLSEHLLTYCKDDPLFLDNLGSYWLVHKKDYKKALKYYNDVLKKHPDDVTAIRNCILLARSKKDTKLEMKYLPMMAKYGETETDRASAQARLQALQKK